MIAAVLAGAVMFGVFIRPALAHDSNLPIKVTGRRRRATHPTVPAPH